MSSVIAVALPSEEQAKEALRRLNQMQKEHLITVLDAAIVTRDRRGDRVRVEQTNDLVTAGAYNGGFWGLLLGLIFANPLVGLATGAIGAGIGALIGTTADIGINDDFMRQIGSQLNPGNAVLFLMVSDITPDKVLERLSDLDMRLVTSSLTHDEEETLRRALGEHAKTATEVFERATYLGSAD